jgi:hypothetical protein
VNNIDVLTQKHPGSHQNIIVIIYNQEVGFYLAHGFEFEVGIKNIKVLYMLVKLFALVQKYGRFRTANVTIF